MSRMYISTLTHTRTHTQHNTHTHNIPGINFFDFRTRALLLHTHTRHVPASAVRRPGYLRHPSTRPALTLNQRRRHLSSLWSRRASPNPPRPTSTMAPPPVLITVQQLVGRLENATSSERLDALQELQVLARTEARLVGEYALQKVLDFLKDQGSSEEYQEALDLIDRLIKNRDKDAAHANTDIVLAATSNVELLLDLLEHKDATVGVMTSQILTEVHARAPNKLEATIQECPAGACTFVRRSTYGLLAFQTGPCRPSRTPFRLSPLRPSPGMNKLLQRLPDSSREEVRNQAIVLVQQLTAHNEEMKKTVVFNEVSGLMKPTLLAPLTRPRARTHPHTRPRALRFCLGLSAAKAARPMPAWWSMIACRYARTSSGVAKPANGSFSAWARSGSSSWANFSSLHWWSPSAKWPELVVGWMARTGGGGVAGGTTCPTAQGARRWRWTP